MPITKLARCPYCPAGGDVSMACTDLSNEDEYQAWCRTCWAHGPSKSTEAHAAEAWNEVSMAVRGMELTPGKVYILSQAYNGLPSGQKVVFRWRSEDGKFNVFNPEGEADMQSAFSFLATDTARYVRRPPVCSFPVDTEASRCEDCNAKMRRVDADTVLCPICVESIP